MSWKTLLLGALCLPVGSAAALTLSEAVRRAEGLAPQAQAYESAARAAQSEANAAGRLPAPMWSIGVQNLPIDGPDAGSFGADLMTMRMVGVEQALPSRALREAAQSQWQAGARQASAQANLASRERAMRVGERWIDGWRAQQELTLLSGQLDELELAQAQAAQAARSSTAELALALKVARGQLETERDRLHGDIAAARARLEVDLALPTLDFGADLRGWTEPDITQLRATLPTHPLLRAADAAREAAGDERRAVIEDGKPQWSVMASYGARSVGRDDMLSVGVGLRFDGLAGSRQSAKQRAAAQREQSAEALRDDVLRDLSGQLVESVARYRAARAAQQRLTSRVQADADQQVALATQRYAAGGAALADVLQRRRENLDIARQALAHEADALRALLQLYFLATEWPQ